MISIMNMLLSSKKGEKRILVRLVIFCLRYSWVLVYLWDMVSVLAFVSLLLFSFSNFLLLQFWFFFSWSSSFPAFICPFLFPQAPGVWAGGQWGDDCAVLSWTLGLTHTHSTPGTHQENLFVHHCGSCWVINMDTSLLSMSLSSMWFIPELLIKSQNYCFPNYCFPILITTIIFCLPSVCKLENLSFHPMCCEFLFFW